MGVFMDKIKPRFFYIPIQLALLCAVLSACAGSPSPVSAQASSRQDELDTAIRETSNYLNKQLSKGNKLMILNVQSDFPALSEYIIDELIANTVNDRVFSVVDRQQLNTIRAELNFQMSGEVDDSTAQSLGRMAGAQIIISGAVSRIGDLYRLRVRALSVQSAQIEGQFNRNIPNGPTVTALVNSKATGYGSGPAVTSTGSTTRQASSSPAAPVPAPAPAVVPTPAPVTPAAQPTTYNIGDKGPAGGIIFFDMGFDIDGWRYMEAAPQDIPGKFQWGAYGQNIGTQTALGSGKRNTEIIVLTLKNNGETARAAQVADVAKYSGYDDWFLPSKDELDLMYKNLKQKYLGNFQNTLYWSSSEGRTNYALAMSDRNNGGFAWYQDFNNGVQTLGSNSENGKNESYSVRVIRRFK
jgi:hypothetical protein